MSYLKRFSEVNWLFGFYRRLISPLLHGCAGCGFGCRFLPTCSEYAEEAIQVHGAGRGLWLTVRRLGKCQPFGSKGWDPVPEKSETNKEYLR